MDYELLGAEIAALVGEAQAPLLAEIKRLQDDVFALKASPAPKDGTSITPADVEPMLRKMVDAIELPAPEDVDVDAVSADAAKRLLGSDGLKALCTLVAAEAVAGLPPAAKGEDGKSVELDDVVAKLLPGLEDRFQAIVAQHVLDIERRAQGVLERAVAAIPKPRDGADGKDGLSIADVARTYDSDAHEIVERWTVAGEAKELRYPAGGIRPGGFWREGLKCHALQAITHDGALWIAKRDNCSKPCIENADDWQLAARKGRDGRDGKDGKPPPSGVPLTPPKGDSDG